MNDSTRVSKQVSYRRRYGQKDYHRFNRKNYITIDRSSLAHGANKWFINDRNRDNLGQQRSSSGENAA